MNYWPGTKIVKSQGNAFTLWKEGRPSLANNQKWKQSLIGQQNAFSLDKRQIHFKKSK